MRTLSRRSLIKYGGALASGAALATLGLPSVARAAVPPFIAYHGVSGATHQDRFDELYPQGFRLISLSVYGDPADARYAAVWVQRPGPAWAAVHGLSVAEYQAAFDHWAAHGLAPTLISATGPAASAVFAGIFEAGVTGAWLARHTLRPLVDPKKPDGTFQHECWQARAKGLVLRSAAIYGTAADRRYAGVWAEDSAAHWAYRTEETSVGHQTSFDAFMQVPLRPAFVTLSADQRYLSVYRDDSIGPWIARHNLTSSQYQSEFTLRVGQGYFPVCVQGGGSGSATRYAVIFAKQEQPVSRQWTVAGAAVPALAAVDQAVKDHMQRYGIRAGTLAIAKHGVVRFARAYTWAEPGYQITQPSSPFRLASISKAFTCAAIQRLYDTKQLTPDTRVFARLSITTKALPWQTVDARVNDITVQHLVDHLGGWIRDKSNFDPISRLRDIAGALRLSRPPTELEMARYMYGEPLQFTPGTDPGVDAKGNKWSSYSNFGYVLLTALIERVTGQSFITFLKSGILTPEGIADVHLARTLRSQRLPNEVAYEYPEVGESALQPKLSELAPHCYGGEGWTTESMDGSGGLAATASALVRFIHAHAAWGLGGRQPASQRGGIFAGTVSEMGSRRDGVDYAYIFNTQDVPQAARSAFWAALVNLLNATPLPRSGGLLPSGVLRLTPSTPRVGDRVTAEFTVCNDTSAPLTLEAVSASVRRGDDWGDPAVDFPHVYTITLNPDEEYTYRQARSFPIAGAHIARPTVKLNGVWQSIPGTDRLTFTVRA